MKRFLGWVLLALVGLPFIAAAADSPPAATGPGVCGPATYAQLRPMLLARPARALTPGTLILPGGEEGDIFMLGPVGGSSAVDDYQFRVFATDAMGDPLPTKVDDPRGFTPLHVDRPSQDQSRTLHIVNPEKAFAIHLPIPSDSGWAPWRSKVVVVVACQNNQPVAYGVRRFEASRQIPAWLASGALIGVLYLLAVTMVYFARRRAIEKPPEVQPPLRVTPLAPWSWWRCLDPVVLTSDEFDRGSLSNLQVLFFGGLVAFGLTDLALRSGALSNLSSAILYLIGIPALGTLGTGLAKNSRDRLSAENWAWLVARGVLPVNDAGKNARPRWADLIMTGTVLDLPKLQALTFSLIVGIGMVATGFRDFANFDIPTTLLEILGLSQVVFVGGRFTQPTTMGDLDDMLTNLRTRAQDLRKAAASGRDVDPDGKAVPAGAAPAAGPDGLPLAPRGPYLSLAAAAAPGAVPNAVQRYRDIEEEVAVLLRSLFERDLDVEGLKAPLETPAV